MTRTRTRFCRPRSKKSNDPHNDNDMKLFANCSLATLALAAIPILLADWLMGWMTWADMLVSKH